MKQSISNKDIGIDQHSFAAMWNSTTTTARVVRGRAEGNIQQVVSLDNDADRYSSIDEYLAANPQGVVGYGRTNGCHRTEVKEGKWQILYKYS